MNTDISTLNAGEKQALMDAKLGDIRKKVNADSWSVNMENLMKKSKLLTGYLEYLIDEIKDDRIAIITPRNPAERGCQLSIQVKAADKQLFDKITKAGVIADWREPDVIRVAPIPLYNSFEDIYQFANILKDQIQP